MKKEIGGFIELEEYSKGYEYYPDFIALNSARNAFLYYVLTHDIKKVYIPYFLCDCIYKICEKNNIVYQKYHVDSGLKPVFKKKLADNELFYLVNYYGQLSLMDIRSYKNKYKNVLVDNVQCFFTEPVRGVATIYSCRKFYGVPDGGYLYQEYDCDLALETDNSESRMTHLIGRKEKSAQEYYSCFLENEKLIDDLPLLYMSNKSKELLGSADNDFIIRRRDHNFKYLKKRLSKYNKLDIKDNDGPYCYPLLVDDGWKLRKALVKNKIYVPTLWPNVIDEGNRLEKKYARNILPLPCDQRYTEEEMAFMCDLIENYYEK